VLRSLLPGSFLTAHILSKQEVAMAGLKLHVQMFLHAKGDKSNEGAFRPDELLHRVQQSVSRYDKILAVTCSWSPKAEDALRSMRQRS
jgi:hypothetical protein